MKICYLTSLGSTGHAERWIRYFSDSGHEVHLITSNPPDGGIKNLELHLIKRFGPRSRIIGYPLNAVPMILQVKQMIRNINPDVIHAHSIEEGALLGAVSGFHPLVVTPWGSDVLVAPKKSKLSKRLVEYVLKRADLITCDAEHIKQPLINLGADREKIRLICFGVDTKKFKPGPKDEKLRQELEIGNSPTIITSRRLDPDCDIGSLITAIPLVLAEVPETSFVIIGQGSEETKLKDLAISLGIYQNIRFIGWISHDELPRYLSSADIFTSTALSDAGLAASTAEAMACGLPVVITDFGDNTKWVEDGVNGFTVPLKSPRNLASKLVELLKSSETRQKFGRLNRRIIEERNSWDREMEKMGRLYQEIRMKYRK